MNNIIHFKKHYAGENSIYTRRRNKTFPPFKIFLPKFYCYPDSKYILYLSTSFSWQNRRLTQLPCSLNAAAKLQIPSYSIFIPSLTFHNSKLKYIQTLLREIPHSRIFIDKVISTFPS